MDPILDLHTLMGKMDLLSEQNQNYENFRAAIMAPGGMKKVYGVLKDNGIADIPYGDFEKGLLGSKKKDFGDGSSASLSTSDANAPSADTNTSLDAGEAVSPASGTGEPQKFWKQGNVVTEGDLMAGGVPGVVSESTRTNTPVKKTAADLNFNGTEDPIKAGKQMLAEHNPDFYKKESYINKSVLKKGAFDLESIGHYAQALGAQQDWAAATLSGTYGDDWQDFLKKAKDYIENPPANASPLDLEGMTARYNQIIEDPSFKKWQNAIQGQQSAQSAFVDYGKQNPEYAQKLAIQAANRAKAEGSQFGTLLDWGDRKLAQVIGGIASIPRTLLGVIPADVSGTQPGVIANGLGEWADKLVESANVNMPAPAKYNQALWQKVAPFGNYSVVVDSQNRPVQAFDKDGKEKEIDAAFADDFAKSGAADLAKTKFMGVGNAAYKLADVVSDLYIMRYLGGGSKLGAMASAFALQHRDNYDEGMNDLKLSQNEAAQYAFIKTALNAGIEAFVGSAESEGMHLTSKAVALADAKALAGKTSVLDVAKAAVKPWINQIADENKEEVLQMFGDKTVNAVYNGVYGTQLDTDIDPADLAETLLMTTIATGLSGSVDAMRRGRSDMQRGALLAAVQNPDALNQSFEILQQNGVLSEDDVLKGKARAAKMADIYSRLPESMSEENKAEAALLEYGKMINEVAYAGSPSSAQQQILKDENKAADEQIANLMVNNPPTEAESEVGSVELPKGSDIVIDQEGEKPNLEDANMDPNDIFVSPTTDEDFVGKVRSVPLDDRQQKPSEKIKDSTVRVADAVQSYAAATDEDASRNEQEFVDDAVNIALSRAFKSEREKMSTKDMVEFHDFVRESITDKDWQEQNAGESFHGAMENLLRDFFLENRINQRSEVNRGEMRSFHPETVDDHIADLFANGTRVSSSHLKSELPAEAKEGAVFRYGAKSGVPIDDMVDSVWSAMHQGTGIDIPEMSTSDAIDIRNRVLEFIQDNPKGPMQHIKKANQRNKDADIDELVNSGYEESEVRAAVEDQEKSMTEMTATDLQSLEKAMAPYTDESGKLDAQSFIKDFEKWDPFENPTPHFQQLTPKALDHVEKQIRQEIGEQTGDIGVGSQQGEAREASNGGRTDVPVTEAATETGSFAEDARRLDEEIETAPLPDKLNKPYIQEMYRYGLIDTETASRALRFISGEDSPENREAYQKAMDALPGLRIPPAETSLPQSEAQDGDVLDRPLIEEINGVLWITPTADGFQDALVDAGAVYDPVAEKYKMPANEKDKLDAALSAVDIKGENVESGIEEKPLGIRKLFKQASAIVARAKRKAMFKKAKSFEDRLAIAQALHDPESRRLNKTAARAIDKLKSAFPNVSVITDVQKIDAAKNEMVASGEISESDVPNLNGFVYKGKVYIDPRISGADTPIHEFGHIWNAWMKKNAPTLYQKGIDLIKGSDLFNSIASDPFYSSRNMSDEEIAEEALATAIGTKGAAIMQSGPFVKFKEWLQDMWLAAKSAFGFDPRELTIEQFVSQQARVLLAGKALAAHTSEQVKDLLDEMNEGPAFQVIGVVGASSSPAKMEAVDIAKKMEQSGYDADTIWAATGWEKVEGQWKSEVPYGDLVVDLPAPGSEVALSRIWNAPELYSAYPALKSIPVKFGDITGAQVQNGAITIENKALGDKDNLKRLLTHEIQHLIQEFEGVSDGSNVQEGNPMSLDLREALNSFKSMQKIEPMDAQSFVEKMEIGDYLESAGIYDDFIRIASQGVDAIDAYIENAGNIALGRYMLNPGEVESRNAELRAFGAKGRISKTADASIQRMSDFEKYAAAMFRDGVDLQKIYEATGWHMDGVGNWHYNPVYGKYYYNSNFRGGTLSELVDRPAFFEQFPELKSYPVEFWANNGPSEVILDQGRAIIKGFPDIDGSIVTAVMRGAATLNSAVLPTDTDVLQKAPAEDLLTMAGETNQRFGGVTKYSASNPTPVSVNSAAVLQTVNDIFEEEIRDNGLKDIDAKMQKTAATLGVPLSDVKRIVEKIAAAKGYGRLHIEKGDNQVTVKKKVSKMFETAKRFGRKYFTKTGLMPNDIFEQDRARIGRINGMTLKVEFLVKELERAMKEEYGKDLNETHWRMADNVLRGEGDWSILPQKIEDVLKKMRELQDEVSLELVKSGIYGGNMLIGVLKNAGYDIDENAMKQFNGVNVVKALQKLPFERTVEEMAAVDDFLAQRSKELGTYLYRSYRVHDDAKDWMDKVSPRVLDDARSFMEQSINDRLDQLKQLESNRVDVLSKKIVKLHDANTAEILGIQDTIDEIEAKIQKALDEIDKAAKVGKKNMTYEKSYTSNKAKLAEIKKQMAAAITLTTGQMPAVINANSLGVSKLSGPVNRVIKRLQKISELQAAVSNTSRFDAAEAILQDRLRNIDAELASMAAKFESPTTGFASGKPVGIPGSLFKKKKDIPNEIREFLGEYHDPRLNFMKSALRSVTGLNNQLFLTDLKEAFQGQLFFEKPTDEFIYKISSEGSRTLSPIAGLYTSKDIKEAIEGFDKSGGEAPYWLQLLQQAASGVKYGKTILSPITHARNFASNMWISMANAYNPGQMRAAGLAFADTWGKIPAEDQQKALVRMAELGIVGGGANAGVIKDYMQKLTQNGFDKTVDKLFGTAMGKVLEKAESAYAAEDDFYRILAFETEKARYSKALYGDSFENLSAAEQKAIEEKAAELVNNLLPTYALIPKIIRELQAFPFVGTFVAFPAEMFRVTYNHLLTTNRELRDPRLRSIGMSRALGMGAQIAVSAGLAMLFRHLAGVDKDREDAARYFCYPWQKDATLIWYQLDGKEMSFTNLSYTDPYAFLKRPVTSILTSNNDQDFLDKMTDAAWTFFEPFLSPELTSVTMGQVLFNKNLRTGEEIYNKYSPFMDKFSEVSNFVAYNLQPGFLKFGRDFYSSITQTPIGTKPPKQLIDIALSLPGLQTERRNMEQAVGSKVRELVKAKEGAREIFSANRWKYENDQKKLDEIYQTSQTVYNETLKEANFAVANAKKVGVDEAVINRILLDRKFSKAEVAAINSGTTLKLLFKGYNK